LEVARELEARTQGQIAFAYGTLYPILQALQKNGLVTSEWIAPEGERARRVYTITERGLKAASQAESCWRASVRWIEGILDESGGGAA
jgi:DNA-binding PadR family transcriptional regulator